MTTRPALRARLLLGGWALFSLWQGTAALAALWRRSADRGGFEARLHALFDTPDERWERGVGELAPIVAAVRANVPTGAAVALCARVDRESRSMMPRELDPAWRQRLVALLVPHPVVLLVLDQRGVAPALTVPADLTPFVGSGLHVLELGPEGPFPGRDGARLLAHGPGFRLWFATKLTEDP